METNSNSIAEYIKGLEQKVQELENNSRLGNYKAGDVLFGEVTINQRPVKTFALVNSTINGNIETIKFNERGTVGYCLADFKKWQICNLSKEDVIIDFRFVDGLRVVQFGRATDRSELTNENCIPYLGQDLNMYFKEK